VGGQNRLSSGPSQRCLRKGDIFQVVQKQKCPQMKLWYGWLRQAHMSQPQATGRLVALAAGAQGGQARGGCPGWCRMAARPQRSPAPRGQRQAGSPSVVVGCRHGVGGAACRVMWHGPPSRELFCMPALMFVCLPFSELGVPRRSGMSQAGWRWQPRSHHGRRATWATQQKRSHKLKWAYGTIGQR